MASGLASLLQQCHGDVLMHVVTVTVERMMGYSSCSCYMCAEDCACSLLHFVNDSIHCMDSNN